jgi:hypothetical protein
MEAECRFNLEIAFVLKQYHFVTILESECGRKFLKRLVANE